MKNIKNILIGVVTVALISSSCNTDELQELNIDPNAANEMDPAFILSYVEKNISGQRYENWRAQLIYQSTMIQHFATLPTYWAGDKYLYIGSYSASLWERGYTTYIKDNVNLIEITDPEVVGDNSMININSMARILRVFALHRMTDHYGDIPYFDAGRGFLDNNFNPTYDPQSEIYTDMLNELSEAVANFDASQVNPGNQDYFYEGNLDKWRKWGNSLMLRLGMRLSKVDQDLAEDYVSQAISGGVMESNEDIAFMTHADGPGNKRNGIGEVFNYNGTEYSTDDSPRLSETMVTWLSDNNDPRLEQLSWVVNGDTPKGLPNGYDATTIQEHPSYVDGDDGLDTYSRIAPEFVLLSSPMVHQTYAEVEFLIAEAIERGWATGNAEDHYNAGVRAAMEMYGILYGENVSIDSDDIDTYLAANPYNPTEWDRMIGEQYWMATFLNEYEAYANWRRTGFPNLTPVDYPGNESNGTIPRRLRYPQAEQSINTQNYQTAIDRQGPDQFTTRMWWDVAQ